jgi:hypothetical protein
MKLTEKLEAKSEYLKEWIERYKGAQEVVQYVQTNLDTTEWELQALNNRPDEADEIPLADLYTKFDRDYDYLTSALPMMPQYSPDAFLNSTAVSTSGSASVYEYVARVGDMGVPAAQAYSRKYTAIYHELQAAQARPKAIRDLLGKLGNPQTQERFDRALMAYSAAQSGTGERTTAALEMRTLLDGIKGDLFKKARRRPKENMSWSEMAARLAKGIPRGTEQQELADQELVRTSLISRLSDIAKDREGGSLTNLDNLWTQISDHIYIVLSLIDFGDH